MKKSKLPKTDSIEKLARFWDTHDVADFAGQLEQITEPVFVRELPKGGAATIRSPRLARPEDAIKLRKQIVEFP